MIESVSFNDKEFYLELIDQTLLPVELKLVVCRNENEVATAIKTMQVRGAPAIGVAAAYGIVLGLKSCQNKDNLQKKLEHICSLLSKTRPTAVNLFWAIEQVKESVLKSGTDDFDEAIKIALKEANHIKKHDIEMCRKIGFYGAEYLHEGETWLTHCNAGALATAGFGTALGVFRAAKEQGKSFKVFIDETRPLLQGARLTAWEMVQEKIDATLICDDMAGALLGANKIDGIVVGADRITSSGFVANKIGTYALAVLAKYHGIPFYVAAPDSTFDLSIAYGDDIKIEERDPEEVRHFGCKQTAPSEIKVYNPAFDVTSPELITAIFTNKGVLKPIYKNSIAKLIKGKKNN